MCARYRPANQEEKSAGQLEVSTSLLCHSAQIQNCGNSRLPHHTMHWANTEKPACVQGIVQQIKKRRVQVSLKSVRVFCVTQVRFRTVVIQGFLITPCTGQRLKEQHVCKVSSSKSRKRSAGQLEVSTSLLCHSSQIQNCGNSRLPHHTMHWAKTEKPACVQGIVQQINNRRVQVSLKSVRVFCGTQLRFRTVVIQGFLITPWTGQRLQDPHVCNVSSASSRLKQSAGQLEVSTSLLCHSSQIQNCGNSRLPHHTMHWANLKNQHVCKVSSSKSRKEECRSA